MVEVLYNINAVAVRCAKQNSLMRGGYDLTKMKLYRILSVMMALALMLPVLNGIVGSQTAKAAVTQSQIDDLKQQQKDTEKKKQELQSQISALKAQQADSLQKKKLLDEQIQLTQDEIDNITDQINEYDGLIAQKTDDAQKAQETEDAQWVKYKENMRTMEENGTISYISIIFQANSFTDLLARIDFVGEIMQYDEDVYQKLEADREATIDTRNALQTAKDGQEADKEDLTQKQDELQTQLDAATQLIQKIQGDINSANTLYDAEDASADKIQAEINQKVAALKKQQEQEQQQKQQQQTSQQKQQSGGSVVGTGTLVWPVPSCHIVTSPFGMRYHPVYHRNIMHQGVDIGASWGSDVVAADSGTVISTDYDDGGYGYYMVLDHGNGVTTLYGHLSKFVKHEGDTVKKGDVIAKSGSSGDATGPHLHFEVSVNGSRVDPLKYFSGYTNDY